MGAVCAQARPEKLPYFEHLYTKAEATIILPSIKINNLEALTNEIAYTERIFGIKEIAKVFGKYEVMEENFYDINSSFMVFFDGIENAKNCKRQFIMTCLPFCQGTLEEKGELVWIYNEEETTEAIMKAKKFGDYLKMITRLSTVSIGKLIKGETDTETKSLMGANDEQIDKYVADLFSYAFGIDLDDSISKGEFERMLKQASNNELFEFHTHSVVSLFFTIGSIVIYYPFYYWISMYSNQTVFGSFNRLFTNPLTVLVQVFTLVTVIVLPKAFEMVKNLRLHSNCCNGKTCKSNNSEQTHRFEVSI